jgi:hypothetical protein
MLPAMLKKAKTDFAFGAILEEIKGKFRESIPRGVTNMRHRYPGLLVVLLLVLISCSPKISGPMVETIGELVWVHNPAIPLHPDRTVTFEEELTFGGDESNEEAMLYQPSDLLVDESGNIYVSDYRDAVIKVYGPDGGYIRTIGHKGEGPGEFQSLMDMQFLNDGRMLVFDLRARRSSLFDKFGNFIASHPWRYSQYQILFVDDVGYLTEENVYGEENKLLVTKFDYEGNELETWGEFVPMGMQMKRVGDAMLSITTPQTPQSIFAGDSARRRLYHCFNDTYLIEVYEAPGKLVRKIDRPYTPVPFTKEDAEEYYASIDRRDNKQFSDIAREIDLPEVKTVTQGMLLDDLGNLWVATNEVDESGERSLRAWDIFTPEGHYTCRMWMDMSPGLFVRGKMYRLHSDEDTGFRTVKRYRVTWSE